MEHAFALIKQLVADFKAQEAAYLSSSYQEQHVREDFINKFFIALGWDVTHERQKNPYEQEVKIENKVSTQGSQRRADYAFFIAPNFRDVKFYAEAKKPAKNLKDAAFYHQTIRYGWNSGTPIAILTDFEEFHILDCRYKPDIEDALNRKLEYFHYSEYADEEKFKKIFFLFGRETVANGSLEKYAAMLPKPRGKAKQRGLFKGGYQPVDEAFLEELDSYRETLAKAFKKENPDLGSEELTEAVQRTIDRLVFIRFLEDKQIEDPQMINYSEASSAWKKFSTHCRALEPKYNGLVFKKHRILDDSGFVPPDDKTFAGICEELADPSSPYDFDKIPISILGSIYERFLGKVVHATAKQVRVEPKPEVRKAGGVYYTPQYIVRYIVKETVGKLLYATPTVSTKNVEPTPPYQGGETQDKISSPQRGEVSRRDRGVDNFDSLQGKTPEEVAKMSFADIACGSGSFLIEVYSVLLEYHERYYASHPEMAKKGDLSTRDGKQVLSLRKRQEILVNNIYGVDIDFQATEVTQLSLYLKLLEEATLNDAVQFSLLKEKLLPDLRNNIICGNSLIGIDINTGELFENEELKKLKPMNFEDAFPAVMKKGGFDAVVGNPPYRIIGKADITKQTASYLVKKFTSFQYKADLYHLFIEKALGLCRTNGLIGYITPNTWYTLPFTQKLRQYVLENSHLVLFVIFNHQVFKEANVDTVITIAKKISKQRTRYENEVLVFNMPKEFEAKQLETVIPQRKKQGDWITNETNQFGIRTTTEEQNILDRIEKVSKPLTDIAKASLGTQAYNSSKHTKDQIKDRVFHSKKKVSKDYLKELSGSDIGRYTLQWAKKEWIKYGPWLHDYRTMDWLEGPRILIREITGKGTYKICGMYVEEIYCNYKTILNVIYGNEHKYSMKYFLGLLNSQFLSWVYPRVSNKTVKDSFPRLSVSDLKKLPIRTIDFANEAEKAKHDHIVSLVEQMLKAKEELAAAKLDSDVQRLEHRCATLDRQIDEAVYELYGLTEEEIKIVEGKL
ncbi:MAG: TaqI-like C-terminal specificity domain-containing protein [Bacteroidota bacterium]|jgi:adenine-specific DNA-methyltransferase